MSLWEEDQERTKEHHHHLIHWFPKLMIIFLLTSLFKTLIIFIPTNPMIRTIISTWLSHHPHKNITASTRLDFFNYLPRIWKWTKTTISFNSTWTLPIPLPHLHPLQLHYPQWNCSSLIVLVFLLGLSCLMLRLYKIQIWSCSMDQGFISKNSTSHH